MQAVCNLIDAALNGEIYYDEFAQKVRELGVESISLDVIRGHHTFYTTDGQVFDHPLLAGHSFPVAAAFSKDAVAAAITGFDKRELNPAEFHRALTQAGVSFARCYYEGNRAIYISPKGEFYLEQW